jgi:hypothetical protein
MQLICLRTHVHGNVMMVTSRKMSAALHMLLEPLSSACSCIRACSHAPTCMFMRIHACSHAPTCFLSYTYMHAFLHLHACSHVPTRTFMLLHACFLTPTLVLSCTYMHVCISHSVIMIAMNAVDLHAAAQHLLNNSDEYVFARTHFVMTCTCVRRVVHASQDCDERRHEAGEG